MISFIFCLDIINLSQLILAQIKDQNFYSKIYSTSSSSTSFQSERKFRKIYSYHNKKNMFHDFSYHRLKNIVILLNWQPLRKISVLLFGFEALYFCHFSYLT
jgi:hypothetical protein